MGDKFLILLKCQTCRSIAMAKDVHTCLLEITAAQRKTTLVEAQDYWTRIMADGDRYVRDIWT